MVPYERFMRRGSLSVVPKFFEHEPLRYEGFAECHKGR